jgi:hypothetical protein
MYFTLPLLFKGRDGEGLRKIREGIGAWVLWIINFIHGTDILSPIP